MLKRTLVSAALMAAFSTNAAVVSTPAAKVFSLEGSIAANDYLAPNIDVALGAEYQVGDTVTFAFDAKFATGYSLPANITGAQVITTDAADGARDTSSAGLTLGFLSNDDTSATYRVTAIDSTSTIDSVLANGNPDSVGVATNSGSTIGSILSLDGVKFDDASLEAATKSGVTYSAQTSNAVTIDSATTNTLATIVSVKDELSSKIVATDRLSSDIDVASQRLELATGSDTVKITTVADNTITDGSATVSETKITLNGDFSWVLDTSSTTAGVQAPAGVIAALDGAFTAASSVVVTPTSVVATWASSSYVGTFDIVIDPRANYLTTGTQANGTILAATAFTADVAIKYAATSADVTTGLNAGKFGLNGDTAIVRAYPVSSAVENFLWVTNDGTLDGEISVVATAEGVAYDLGNVGVAKAKSVTRIGPAVDAALAAEGVTSGRAQLSITTNAPATNVHVSASYKVTADADRLTLDVNN